MNLEDEVRRLAGAARKKVATEGGPAEVSQAGVEVVDRYLDAHRDEFDEDEVVAFGCYLAEVVVAELGGHMLLGKDVDGNDALEVQTGAGVRCWPAQWVAKTVAGDGKGKTLAMLVPALRSIAERTAT